MNLIYTNILRDNAGGFSLIPIISPGPVKHYIEKRLDKFKEHRLTIEKIYKENPVIKINTGIIEKYLGDENHTKNIEKIQRIKEEEIKGNFGTYKIHPGEIEYFVFRGSDENKIDKIVLSSCSVYILGELGIVELSEKWNGKLNAFIRMIYKVPSELSKVVYEEIWEGPKGKKNVKISQELPVSGYVGDIKAIVVTPCMNEEKINEMLVIHPKEYNAKGSVSKMIEELFNKKYF